MSSLANLVNKSKAVQSKESPVSDSLPRADATVQAGAKAPGDSHPPAAGLAKFAQGRKSESKAVPPSPASVPTPATPSANELQEVLTPNTEANLEMRMELAAESAVPLMPGEIDVESVATQTGKMKAEEGLNEFLANLREIPNLYDSPEILSSQIRAIMVDLQENPHFSQHIEPLDIGLMVRGMRESLGVAQIKKSENKAKKGGTSKAAKTANALAMSFDELGGITL